MAAFAKLFELEGIGQVLATLETADDDDADGETEFNELIRFRIEDGNGLEFRMALQPRNAEDLQKIWGGIDATTIRQHVKPLLAARASFAAITG